MSARDKIIFKIANNPVMFWGTYGAVCPTYWTTNGSIKMLAECIAAKRTPNPDLSFDPREKYAITDSILPPNTNFDDAEKLRRAIVLEWDKWKEELASFEENQNAKARMMVERAKIMFDSIPEPFLKEATALRQPFPRGILQFVHHGLVLMTEKEEFDMMIWAKDWKDEDRVKAENRIRVFTYMDQILSAMSKLAAQIKQVIASHLAESRKTYIELRRLRSVFGKLSHNMTDTRSRFFDAIRDAEKVAPPKDNL